VSALYVGSLSDCIDSSFAYVSLLDGLVDAGITLSISRKLMIDYKLGRGWTLSGRLSENVKDSVNCNCFALLISLQERAFANSTYFASIHFLGFILSRPKASPPRTISA